MSANMDTNTVLPPHFNLTGQVAIQILPDFMGNYSFVYQGTVHGNLVAVKIIKATGDTESMKRKVIRERVVWGSMNHPNIHPFYGYADDPGFGPFGALVSPWSARGDASRFLKKNGQRMIMAERTNLWKGVIEGVLYLHDRIPPIVHGDLKSGNILINEFGVPTICDFGLARIFLEQGSTGLTTTSEHTGTARYLAPELVASDTPVYPTLASDVYALGCLGLDFIYLQQPFSNHPNNLRGQIFRDLRRGLPPAIGRPAQAWPSIRIWPIIVNCWNFDHQSRPSAPAAARMLRRTILAFPTFVIKKIAHFVDTWADTIVPISVSRSRPIWKERCRCLRHLCLVSRAYRECATPFLYREIRLNLQKPQCLFALISTLDSSPTKSLFYPREPSGYGSYTQFIAIEIGQSALRQSDLAVGIRNLIDRLPRLRLVQIHDSIYAGSAIKLPSLTTLGLSGVDLAILFDHRPTLQALESLQRLEIRSCSDIASSSRPLREPHHTVYLPNLLGISFHYSITMPIHPFATISTWIMPHLRSLNFSEPVIAPSVPSGFFTLLQTHGPKLQSLALASYNIRKQDISNLLTLCTDLRSLDMKYGESLFVLSASHARLEKIKFVYWQDLWGDSALETAIHALKSFKLGAEKSFPKLIEVELTVDLDGLREAMGFFRTADTFITFRHGDKTYRLFDGQADPVGACFD